MQRSPDHEAATATDRRSPVNLDDFVEAAESDGQAVRRHLFATGAVAMVHVLEHDAAEPDGAPSKKKALADATRSASEQIAEIRARAKAAAANDRRAERADSFVSSFAADLKADPKAAIAMLRKRREARAAAFRAKIEAAGGKVPPSLSPEKYAAPSAPAEGITTSAAASAPALPAVPAPPAATPTTPAPADQHAHSRRGDLRHDLTLEALEHPEEADEDGDGVVSVREVEDFLQRKGAELGDARLAHMGFSQARGVGIAQALR